MTLSPKYSSSCQHSQSHRSLQDHNTPSFPASSLRITSTPHRDDFGVAKPPARRDPRAPGAPPVWQPPGRGQRRPSAVLSATPMARRPLCAVSQCPLSLFCLRAARQPAGSPPASLTPGTAPIPASLAPRGGEWEVVGRPWARQRCPRLARTRARPVPRAARHRLAGPPVSLLAALIEAAVPPSSGPTVLDAEATSPAALRELGATENRPGGQAREAPRPGLQWGRLNPKGFEALGWRRTSRPQPPGGRGPTLAARMAAGGLRRPLGVVTVTVAGG